MSKLQRLYCVVDKRDWLDVHTDGDNVEIEVCVEGERVTVALSPRMARTLIKNINYRLRQIT